jgi:hypothetical protein
MGIGFSASKKEKWPICNSICMRSWWVIVFSAISLACYFQVAHSRAIAMSELSGRLQDMEKAKIIASEQQEELTSRLQSETDPAWIEMVLMKDLGVVPEGWVKVQFQK